MRGGPSSATGPVRVHLRRAVGGIILVLAIALASGCQVKVAVDATVDRNGSGTVAVGVGLDDQALSRLGRVDPEVRLSDLAAAGWTVVPATKEADGLTWIRASKHVADAADLDAVMAEISGRGGLFRDFTFTRTEDGDTTYRLRGTIDPTQGMATFADPDLRARMPGGDPFAGLVQEIEQQEGRPAASMVSVDVSAQIADGPRNSWHATLQDPTPTAVDVALVDPRPVPAYLLVLLVALVVLSVGVVVLLLTRARRRFAPGRG